MFIVFEGADCSGKSTQAKMLHEAISGSILTREPGGTEAGLKLRDIIMTIPIGPETLQMLFEADRLDHCHNVILPNKNKVVISDRYYYSSLVYQDDTTRVLEFNKRYNIPEPDYVFILHSSRVPKNQDLMEQRVDYQVIKDKYKALKGENIYHIFTDDKSKERVHFEVCNALHRQTD